MPRFANYKGMAPGKLIMEFNDKLHINGRVYRTSDLSELVGKNAMPPMHNASSNGQGTNTSLWTLRLKRGYQPWTRNGGIGNTPHNLLADFDAGLCGVWSGVTTSGMFLDANKFRLLCGANAGNMVLDIDTETGAISNSESNNVFAQTGINEQCVFLPAGAAGAIAMFRNFNASGGVSSIESYPAGAAANSTATALNGNHTITNSAIPFHYRINDHALRWFFLSINASTASVLNMAVQSVLKSSLALTTINASLAAPGGATAIGASGLGYANSIPSYATNSAANELSSYVLWRTSTNMEIHRVQISNTDSTPTVSNNMVTLDSNPMTLHGNTSTASVARIQLVTHTDGNKYLMIFGIELYGATPNANTATLHVYKLTDKNTGQFVASYTLASGPRAFLAADDSAMRFVMVYDDRYEFWAMGAAGALSKVETVYVPRNNAAQYYEAESYGFDNAGRFWYVTADSQKPVNVAELGLNFYSAPGQVNTITVTFDSDNYTYNGAPVAGNLSVSVKDVTGAYVAALVNLSPTSNITLQSSTVNTNTSGPTVVPFNITAAGDLQVDAWT